MTNKEILAVLQGEIHTTVFATVDDDALPQTCVIDLMLADENGLYFLTAKGKSFYRRLMAKPFVALSGMKGADTLSSIAISVRGRVRCIGRERLDEIFEKNPYMAKIYPTPESREALVVFQLYQGEGEYFDLSHLPPFRQRFSLGDGKAQEHAYRIASEKCIGCTSCLGVCPTGCISGTTPRAIDASHCLHCGNCLSACPVHAVERT